MAGEDGLSGQKENGGGTMRFRFKNVPHLGNLLHHFSGSHDGMPPYGSGGCVSGGAFDGDEVPT